MQYEELLPLLDDFLDDKLSKQQKQRISDALQESTELAAALTNLQELRQASQQWVDEEVPDWHRNAFAARVHHRPNNWMNWFSLATSVTAIFLLVFRIQIVSNEEGFRVSFGDQIDKVAFREHADNYLNDWQEEQVAYFDLRLLEFENQQLQQSQQSMTAALEFNRGERYKDLNQLTSYFLQQRSRDLMQTQSQYLQLVDSQSEDRQAIDKLYASIEK